LSNAEKVAVASGSDKQDFSLPLSFDSVQQGLRKTSPTPAVVLWRQWVFRDPSLSRHTVNTQSLRQ
jgi:hypothetical protein